MEPKISCRGCSTRLVNYYGTGCYNCGGWGAGAAAATAAAVTTAAVTTAAAANSAATTSNTYNAGYTAGATNTAATSSANTAAATSKAYNAGYTASASTTGNAAPAVNYSMGQFIAVLPAGCITPSVQGTTYCLCGNTWFSATYGANGVYYKVVLGPNG